MNKHKKTEEEEEETNLSLLAMKLLNLPPQILRGLGELDGGHDGVVLLLRAQLADASVVGCNGAARVTTAMVGMSRASKLEPMPRSDISWLSVCVHTKTPVVAILRTGLLFSFFLSFFLPFQFFDIKNLAIFFKTIAKLVNFTIKFYIINPIIFFKTYNKICPKNH